MAIKVLEVESLYWVLIIDLGEATVGRYVGKGKFHVIGSGETFDSSQLFVLSKIEIENRVSGNNYVIGSE